VDHRAVISAVGLTKIFMDFWNRARVRAVNDLDLEVEPGEIFGLLGPNGSGKSTAIKMILGLLYPSRGRVSVFGRPPDDVRIKSRIGYLPEESYLYRFLNARETLEYYGTLFQLPRRQRRRRTEELLEMVGLRSAARRPVGEYSKGMARRIGLAQALINDPDLLILDEPTSGLDPIGAKLVKDIILRIGREFKKTILLSSHLLADVEEVCGRVTILFGGRAQVTGRIEDVLSRRDMVQITCGRLAPQTLEHVQRIIREEDGEDVTVSSPRERLETLFLRIVEQAHAEHLHTDGTAPVGEIAKFLGEEPSGEEVLESLVRVEPETPEPAVETPADEREPAAEEAAVLEELSAAGAESGEQAEPDTADAPAPQVPATRESEAVDRSVLDELTGQSKDDKAAERGSVDRPPRRKPEQPDAQVDLPGRHPHADRRRADRAAGVCRAAHAVRAARRRNALRPAADVSFVFTRSPVRFSVPGHGVPFLRDPLQ
jgi:ABC-2 type transport system ATP-binding protein